MIKSISIKISGKVQGVFFRAATKERADELSIKGFVRNEIGGGVYIEAGGSEEALHEFSRWCRHGPPSARVEKCEVKEEKFIKDFLIFDIRR